MEGEFNFEGMEGGFPAGSCTEGTFLDIIKAFLLVCEAVILDWKSVKSL